MNGRLNTGRNFRSRLYRNGSMKEKAVSITLRLVATEDLLGGVGDGGSEEGYFTLHVVIS